MFESRLARQKVPKRRVRSRLRELLKALIGFPNEGWRARNRRAFPPDLLMMAVTTLFVHDDVKRNDILGIPMASALFCAGARFAVAVGTLDLVVRNSTLPGSFKLRRRCVFGE